MKIILAKTKILTPAVCLAILLISASCKKTKTEPTEIEKLPPITQTGAKTFGCLVNGKAWIPEGYESPTPNYRVEVDPTFNDGVFGISCYKIFSWNPYKREDITFGSDSIKSTGLFTVTRIGIDRLRAHFGGGGCGFNPTDPGVYVNGFLKLTRYDLGAGIFSGEFEFTLKPVNCDTIKITNGRFDYKF